MSESTLQAAAVSEPNIAEPPPSTRARAGARFRRHPWWIGALALAAFSFVLLHILRTRPGYDPYGWLIWGYQTLHLKLDLGGAPSWKPLTWLFNTPFAVFGHTGSLWLWMTFSVSVALAGAFFAGRLAFRLCVHVGVQGRAAVAGGIFAGACLLGIQDYMHYLLSAQSDPVIVTFCLAAIDSALSRRPRVALTLLTLASLGRPETWPFLGLYAIWVWRTHPNLRWLILAELAVIPLLWFGMPALTNGKPTISADLALNSPRELHQNKVIGEFHRFTALEYLPVQLLALLGLAIAWLRRSRALLIVAGSVALWLIVEIGFVLHGWPGVPRYLFEAAGGMVVLAGVALAWIIQELPKLPRGRRLPAWSGAVLATVIAATLIPGAIARLRTEHRDLRHERTRTALFDRLGATVSAIGGPGKVQRCGRPITEVEFVSVLAWYTNLNDGALGHRPKPELRQHHPSLLFMPVRGGWSVLPHRLHHHSPPYCRSLRTSFVVTPRHPDGFLTRYIPIILK